ncbi:MAG: hypothetical protein MI920_00995 [Kiloniellales bacterium]|nr:hypothetical protein [Kiloniellales bacterium]
MKADQIRRLRTTALVAASLILLAACGSNKRGGYATDELQFDGNSPDALVIVGLRSTAEVTDGGLLGRPGRWGVNWFRFDPESFELDDWQKSLRVQRTPCLFNWTSPLGCKSDHRLLQYIFQLLEPGHYVLQQAWNRHGTTVYASEQRSLIVEQSVEELVTKNQIHWFEVKAGEIVYLGDYVFDAAAGEIRLIKIERSDPDIERERSKIPGMKGTIHYRGPNIPRPRIAMLDHRDGN